MRQEYDIISYDVWGNARDGFEVNAAYFTGRIVVIDPEGSNMAINRALNVRGVIWEGEPDSTLYGKLKRNGMPALELRPKQWRLPL